MQNFGRTNTVPIGGTWLEYDDNGGLKKQTLLKDIRSSIEGCNVLEQKLGIPNDPVVNAFRWNSSHYSFFRGSDKYFDNQMKLRFEAVDHHAIDGLTASPAPYGYNWDDLEGPAYSNFLSEVRDEKTNLAVDLAEGKQTYKMVASAMDTIVGYARKIPVGPISVMSNAWLAYKYGWLPAYSSLYEVCKFTKNNLLQRQIKATKTKRTSHAGRSYANSGHIIVTDHGFTTQRIRYGARLVLRNNTMYDIQRLTSLNPLGIAWELVPFSFVFDWFYDIGGFLADSETALSMGQDLKYGFKTYSVKTELTHMWKAQTYGFQMPPNGGSQAHRFINASAFSRFKSYDRQPISSWSLPYAPSAQVNLGSDQIISGLALLQQQFTRKR